jgi:hypothetical protein
VRRTTVALDADDGPGSLIVRFYWSPDGELRARVVDVRTHSSWIITDGEAVRRLLHAPTAPANI